MLTCLSGALFTVFNGDSEVTIPDSKVHGVNMGPTWGRQDPGGPHIGPMNLVISNVVTRYVCLCMS